MLLKLIIYLLIAYLVFRIVRTISRHSYYRRLRQKDVNRNKQPRSQRNGGDIEDADFEVLDDDK